jgi:hypothetical protein
MGCSAAAMSRVRQVVVDDCGEKGDSNASAAACVRSILTKTRACDAYRHT